MHPVKKTEAQGYSVPVVSPRSLRGRRIVFILIIALLPLSFSSMSLKTKTVKLNKEKI